MSNNEIQDEYLDTASQASTDNDEPIIRLKELNKAKLAPVQNSKIKTSLCRNYAEKGFCPYGLKCQFAHGPNQLRCNIDEKCYKTKPCHSFAQKAYCRYGFRCNFLHNHSNSQSSAIPNQVLTSYRSILYEGKKCGRSKLLSQISE